MPTMWKFIALNGNGKKPTMELSSQPTLKNFQVQKLSSLKMPMLTIRLTGKMVRLLTVASWTTLKVGKKLKTLQLTVSLWTLVHKRRTHSSWPWMVSRRLTSIQMVLVKVYCLRDTEVKDMTLVTWTMRTSVNVSVVLKTLRLLLRKLRNMVPTSVSTLMLQKPIQSLNTLMKIFFVKMQMVAIATVGTGLTKVSTLMLVMTSLMGV